MERRQLSSPVQKMERVKQSSNRPKIVSTRTAATGAEFALPSSAAIGSSGSTQKFTSPFSESGRDFSMLTRGLTFEIPNFNFLGVRGSGEKIAFIIEASKEMLNEKSACAHIRKELNRVLAEMSSSTVFNVLLYNNEKVAAFTPTMEAVTEENVEKLDDWLEGIWSTELSNGNYETSKFYDTVLGDGARGWVLAAQSALEQCADSVFVVGRNWGFHGLGEEKGKTLVEFTLWEFLGITNEREQDDVCEADRDLRDGYLVGAVELWKMTKRRKLQICRRCLSEFRRLYAVFWRPNFGAYRAGLRENYTPINQAPPQINLVRVVSETQLRTSDSSTSNMRELTRLYNGELGTLNTARLPKIETQIAESPIEKTALFDNQKSTESAAKISFFGKRISAENFGFGIDVSSKIRNSEFGGAETVEWFCEELAEMVEALSPTNELSVFAVSDSGVFQFSEEEKSANLRNWLKSVSTNETNALKSIVKKTNYDSAIGDDISGVPFAIQLAVEQGADSIFAIGQGFGSIPVCREKAEKLLEFELFHLLGSEGRGDEKIDDLIDGKSLGMLNRRFSGFMGRYFRGDLRANGG